MSTLFALAVIAIGIIGIAGFMVVLIGVRQEERRMRLPVAPDTHSAAFARRVIGVHVRDNRSGGKRADRKDVSSAVTGGAYRPAASAPTRPARAVRTAL